MKKKKVATFIQHLITYIILGLSVVVVLFPLLWIISTSVKQQEEIYASPPVWISASPTGKNYLDVLTNSNIPQAFFNSMVIGFGTAIISLILGGLCGYGFSRFRFGGNRQLSLLTLVSQMLPVTVLMIPMYYLISDIGLIDKKIGVTIAHLVIALPMVVWMTKGYVNGISKEFEEAAMIDGCSPIKTLWYVVLPLLRPSIAATGVYAFISSWNEFALANVLTRTMDARTLPLTLNDFSTFFKVDWGSTMAAASLITIPVIIIFMLVQNQFIGGLASGGLKE